MAKDLNGIRDNLENHAELSRQDVAAWRQTAAFVSSF